MSQARLKDTLRSIVQEYGLEEVNQTLGEFAVRNNLRSMVQEHGFELVNQILSEIGSSEHERELSNRATRPETGAAGVRTSRRKTKRPVAAPQYVAKMELQPEIERSIVELANRFQDKTFLPTFGDVANFCQSYGIDEPASRTRSSAIPRVFKLLASMEADEIQRIVDWGMFSGPSQLRPISEAIRRNGRAARAAARDHAAMGSEQIAN